MVETLSDRTDPKTIIAEITLPNGGARKSIRMHASPNGVDQTVRELQNHGWIGFEHPLPIKFFEWAKRSSGVIADVGANTGLYSLLGTYASMKNDVLAFEADPNVIDVLKNNVLLNYGHRISIIEKAISNNPGHADFYIPVQGHGLVETSSSLNPEFKEEHSSVVSVEVTTIDAVMNELMKPDQRLTLAKIDVEGHEWPALSGAGWTVHKYRPILFVEVLQRAEFDSLSHFLHEHSYLDVPLRPDGRQSAYATVEFYPDAWNHAFVPHERLYDFLT